MICARGLLKQTLGKGLIKAIPSSFPLPLSSSLSFSRSAGSHPSLSIPQESKITLAEILTSEILHEQAEIEVDTDCEDIKAQIAKTFKINDVTGHGVITLERTYRGEHILVTFDCQDTVEDVEDESKYADFENQEEVQLEHNADNENDELNIPNKFGINFDVRITKNESKAVFFCTSTEDRVVIQNVTFVPKDSEEVKNYAGPRYEDLDQSLRDGFQNYLTERKIDEDFAFYVLSAARDKEEREYRNWLANLAEFFSK